MKCAIIPVTPYQQNCSVLLCEATKEIAIIDPGGDLPLIRKQIAEMGGKPAIVLLTHGHMDHCAQARVLADELGVPLEGPHKGDKFWLDQLPMACQMVGVPLPRLLCRTAGLMTGTVLGLGMSNWKCCIVPVTLRGILYFLILRSGWRWWGMSFFRVLLDVRIFPGAILIRWSTQSSRSCFHWVMMLPLSRATARHPRWGKRGGPTRLFQEPIASSGS